MEGHGIDPPDAGAVRSLLAEHGEDPGELRLSRLPGGASRETWLVEGGGDRWVLRRDPAGAPDTPVTRRDEFLVMRAASGAGVPTAPMVAYEGAGKRLGGAGFLMGFVEGESIPTRLRRDPVYASALEALPGELAGALARVHATALDDLPDAVGLAPEDPAREAVETWRSALRAIGHPLPAVELGLRWLERDPPKPVASVLVHGDFRMGNLLVSGEGLAAVMDWELCHAGDPAEDVGWLSLRSWRYGGEGQVAGLCGLGEFLAAYMEAGGAEVDPDRVRWWQVMGNVKWAVICAQQAHRHLSGRERSHELASLGRRVCEPEWDMLDLLLERA